MRHQQYFQPADWGTKRVDVIGAGATGSKMAMELAKLGVKNIHVWDDDNIEPHNVANQLYNNSDIGKPKCEALKEHIKEATGTEITVHNERLGTSSTQLGEVVFNLVDTMKSRKEIWESSIKLNPMVRLMIETRMGGDNGRVYAVNPLLEQDIQGWESTLYSDDVAPVSACGSEPTVGATGAMIVGFSIWNFMDFAKDHEYPSEIIFSVHPQILLTKNF